MGTIVDLKTGIIHRYIYELRFDFGQVYWDRAGRIAKKILSEQENWDFERIDLGHCQLIYRDLNLTFNFGPTKLDLSQTQNAEVESLLPVGEFGKLAETFTSAVVETLELEYFPRIGFRVWQLYPSVDREESNEMVQNLKLFSADPGLSGTIGKISEVSHRLVVDRQKHMLRVAVAPFEQQVDLPPSLIRVTKMKAYKQATETHRGPGIDRRRQILIDRLKSQKKIEHYPQFGVLLDLDAYIEDPPYPDHLSVSDFLATAFEDFKDIKGPILAAADSK
jgi:hypothetical protein